MQDAPQAEAEPIVVRDREGQRGHKRPKRPGAQYDGDASWMVGPGEIPRDQIIFEHRISVEGGFGDVWKGTCHGSPVAIKVPKAKFTEKQLQDFRREIRILSRLYNPYICLFMGATLSPNEVCIVTELCDGNVSGLLKDTRVKLSLGAKLRMCRDAARGIAWLHAQLPKVLHRDIKPSNYLYKKSEGKYHIRVCDFGLSDVLSRTTTQDASPKGTPLYMAPEVLQSREVDEKSDVWSWGITLWEILLETEPYSHIRQLRELVQFVAVDHQRLPIPERLHGRVFPPELRDLLQRCWFREPADRPTLQLVIQALDSIMISVAVADPGGQAFWRRNFGGNEEVPFARFAATFFDQFPVLRGRMPKEAEIAPLSGYIGDPVGMTPDMLEDTAAHDMHYNARLYLLRLLKVLFVLPQSGHALEEAVVDMEHFGRCLQWVGPIEADPYVFLIRMQRMFAQPWFYGHTRTEDATQALLTKPAGTFMVRFSNNPNYPGYYVLSVVTASKQASQNVVAHVRIRHAPGDLFALDRLNTVPATASLDALIAQCYTPLSLTLPCPGRKYEYDYFHNVQQQVDEVQQWVVSQARLGGGAPPVPAAAPVAPSLPVQSDPAVQPMNGMPWPQGGHSFAGLMEDDSSMAG